MSIVPHGAADTKKGLISRRLIRHVSEVRLGDRFELWETPENIHARYVVIYFDRGVEATRHSLINRSVRQARDEFERLVEQHYDTHR